MSDDDARRDLPKEEKTDNYTEMLRDLPRLRSAEKVEEEDKVYVAPPPMISRLGGVAQGCGGFIVTLVSLPMLIAALGYGFYVWGPGLFLVGGILLTFGTLGAWRGRRLPILIAMGTILVLAFLLGQWGSFIQPTAVLSPLLQLGGTNLSPYYQIFVQIGIFALLGTFVAHLVGLFYWRMLKKPITRHMVAWGVMIVVLLAIVGLFHVFTQQQRTALLEDKRDDWQQEAPAAASIVLGSNTNIALGISFVSFDEDTDNERYNYQIAELEGVLSTGASPIRMAVSGDMLLEKQEQRIFTDDKVAEGQDTTERIMNAETDEAAYMEILDNSGQSLMLSDYRTSTYLVVKADDDDKKITWDEFAQLHTDRVLHYAELYHPAYYEIVTEPSLYYAFSSIEEPDTDEEKLQQWTDHIEALSAAVEEVSPDTQVGVLINMYIDEDVELYDAVLAMDGIDFISIKAYQNADLDELEDLLQEHGHPRDFDKQLWIAETWYGYCLAPQRSMELDSTWLEAIVAFAAKNRIDGVISSDYGCFVQPGGTLMASSLDADGRTDVWETWKNLVSQNK
ncbi:MAG TPA: hypothetical protein VHP83_27005 [Aggregatilineaceae bacterium]|nr:hypothetical protein [Aggregatilineaceae bacterium]